MNKEYRAIIIDDERLARHEMRSMLSEHREILLVGEACGVHEAVELIEAVRPDLVFLDVQMPGESGFDLLEKTEQHIDVIFITAFDHYAVRAFEVNALDYLLKPVNPDRLARAIKRLSDNEPGKETSYKRLEYGDRLLLNIDGHLRFLKLDSIFCINAEGSYSALVTADGKRSLLLRSLKEWEERLPERYFSRIHRSTIINLEYVEKIESWFGGSYQIFLRNEKKPLTVSRRYAAKLRLKFSL